MAEGRDSAFLGLMKRFGKHLPPPHFDDEDKNRLAKILGILLLHGLMAIILVAVASVATGQYDKTSALAVGGVIVLLLLVLLRSGRLRSAIFLTFIFLLALTTILLFSGGGIHDLASMLYPVIIVIAGLLLRPKEFLAIVVLSLLSASFIILSEFWGLISWNNQFKTTLFSFVTISVIFTLAAVSVRMLANDLKRSLERARRNEQESRDSNVRLQNEIAEHQRTEAALGESEARFRILAEATFEGMCILENNIIIDANSNLAQMLGGKSREIIGRKISEFMDPETAAWINRDQAVAGSPLEHEIRRFDGSQFPAEIRSKLIPSRGRTVRVVAWKDISERRRSEEEHSILENEMRQNQKLESLGILAGGIAHDFNNIISIISGHAELMAGKLKQHSPFHTTLQTIIDATERGSAIVRQILTFARKSEADFRSLHIQELISELVKMLRVTFPRTIEISDSCPPDLPLVWMDPSQLHQALLNLCINARDAMAGTGKLGIATALIEGREIAARFPAAEGKRLIRIQVSDTGMGMDERTRVHVFEPFFTTKGRYQGTGLGLAVVYGVVKTHKGFIEVDSQPGRGTVFSLYFPASEVHAPLPEEQPDLDMEAIPRGSETILVVEDEESLRELLTSMLHEYGYQLLIARDGLEALERYRRHRDDVHLVITDMDLPKLNGAAVSRSILSDNPGAKIILISGFVEPALKASILADGIREFVAKPYTMPQMLKIIRRVLDND
jgi:two-component system cell cycle sensor histidine kinase/response regulator CckA